jgi:ribose 5-phosphate isomerase B
MNIAIGSDHGGWELKERVKKYLEKEGIEFEDFGTENSSSCDYPDFGLPVAEAAARGGKVRGILICTTGIGMSITANKVPGVRAALCNNAEIARLSREHNDANVLVLSAKTVEKEKLEDILQVWLNTNFTGDERHVRRLNKVKQIEEKY